MTDNEFKELLPNHKILDSMIRYYSRYKPEKITQEFLNKGLNKVERISLKQNLSLLMAECSMAMLRIDIYEKNLIENANKNSSQLKKSHLKVVK